MTPSSPSASPTSTPAPPCRWVVWEWGPNEALGRDQVKRRHRSGAAGASVACSGSWLMVQPGGVACGLFLAPAGALVCSPGQSWWVEGLGAWGRCGTAAAAGCPASAGCCASVHTSGSSMPCHTHADYMPSYNQTISCPTGCCFSNESHWEVGAVMPAVQASHHRAQRDSYY